MYPHEDHAPHGTRRTNRLIAAAVTGTALVVAGGVATTLITSNVILEALSAESAHRSQTLHGSGVVDQGQTASGDGQASAALTRGIVDIDTVLGYDSAEAAGTGMVVTADGEVLTNNHVVEGATSITVTVVATGRQYKASVVGTDATDDVALLKLANASGLQTTAIDTKSAVQTGDTVTAVGNAGGTGTLVAASGSITATDQTITTQAEESVASETLNGLIETDAAIVAGDSGGPLYNASGKVIGMDTAASTAGSDGSGSGGYGYGDGGFGGGYGDGYGDGGYGGGYGDGGYGSGSDTFGTSTSGGAAFGSGSTTAGYAIPIADAVAIARQIDAGTASDTVQIGSPAFLGVEVGTDSGDGYGNQQQTAGATVEQVVSGTPAASAGLAAGDTITASRERRSRRPTT